MAKKRTCSPGYGKYHQWAAKNGNTDALKKANPIGGKRPKANVRGH